MEWLFLSCHNYWIVCRLVKDDDHPYLVYSPEITVKDSSEPFRAFLGAILSVVKDVPVERSAYSSNIELDIIEEEDDIDDDSTTNESVRLVGGFWSHSPPAPCHSNHQRVIATRWWVLLAIPPTPHLLPTTNGS